MISVKLVQQQRAEPLWKDVRLPQQLHIAWHAGFVGATSRKHTTKQGSTRRIFLAACQACWAKARKGKHQRYVICLLQICSAQIVKQNL